MVENILGKLLAAPAGKTDWESKHWSENRRQHHLLAVPDEKQLLVKATGGSRWLHPTLPYISNNIKITCFLPKMELLYESSPCKETWLRETSWTERTLTGDTWLTAGWLTQIIFEVGLLSVISWPHSWEKFGKCCTSNILNSVCRCAYK